MYSARLASLLLALAAPASSEPALQIPADSGLSAVETVKPPVLHAGTNDTNRQCVRVVEVVDAARACHAVTCQQLFKSRRIQVLQDGQRALLAGACSSAADTPGRVLLWGSTSLLVLQPSRNDEQLWSQRKKRAEWTIDIETEGSHGTLSHSPKGFQWKEHPN